MGRWAASIAGTLTGYLAEIRFNDPRFARTLWFQRQRAGGVSRRRLTLSSPVQRQQALLNTAFWLESYSISDPAHGSGLLSSLYMAMKGLSVLPRVRTGLAPTGPKQDAMAGHFANLRRSRIDLRACQGIVRQVLRRGVEPDLAPMTLEAGPVRMDVERHEVSVEGTTVRLALKEFDLLEVLLRNAGRVMTRASLIDRVWGADYVGDTKTLDVHIKRLRAKIEKDSSRPVRITTVRGLGYKFQA